MSVGIYLPEAPVVLKHNYSEQIRQEIEEAKWHPKTSVGRLIKQSLPGLPYEVRLELLDAMKRIVVVESSLSVRVFRNLGLYQRGLIDWQDVIEEDYGEVSRKLITDTGVAFLVDAFQNTQEVENFKFHALGTGTNAEAAADTSLQTELTTEYTGNVRATGSQTENAANIYRTVGTNTLDSGTPSVTEHGLMSASSAGTLWDRSKFTAIALNGANGDGLQSTYDATFASGG